MNGNQFFKVPYLGHQKPDMKMLCRAEGGLVAYGRWHVLLGILYQSGGRLELNTLTLGYLADELEFSTVEALTSFLSTLAQLGCVSDELLERQVLSSKGVCDQLNYLKELSESRSRAGKAGGKKSGETRRNKAEASAELSA